MWHVMPECSILIYMFDWSVGWNDASHNCTHPKILRYLRIIGGNVSTTRPLCHPGTTVLWLLSVTDQEEHHILLCPSGCHLPLLPGHHWVDRDGYPCEEEEEYLSITNEEKWDETHGVPEKTELHLLTCDLHLLYTHSVGFQSYFC